MPIYEFYCRSCNTLFNFFAATVDTETRPPCPRCARPELERRPARFATPKRRAGGAEDEEAWGDLDEDRLGEVMESMAEEIGDLGESDDPRQLATLFRRFSEASGLELGPRMEEYMRRLDAGEDPERLEEEMEQEFGDDAEMDEYFRLRRKARAASRRPRVDETLYFL